MQDDAPARDAARELLCRLLAACYYEPGPELGEERVFASMEEAAVRIDATLAADARSLGEAYAGASAQDLLVDYTRLFLGPVRTRAQPYESAWTGLEPMLVQRALLDLYADGGFELDEDFRDLPEHIAAELEFLYLVIFTVNRARGTGDAAALQAAEALRRKFLAEHLAAWVPQFCAAVRAGAETAYFRLLADLTERFVAGEAKSDPVGASDR